jgi:hypothetical protein
MLQRRELLPPQRLGWWRWRGCGVGLFPIPLIVPENFPVCSELGRHILPVIRFPHVSRRLLGHGTLLAAPTQAVDEAGGGRRAAQRHYLHFCTRKARKMSSK